MELDKRFKVLPFCCFGADQWVITNHIGEKGYFANRISYFKDINLCKYGTLGSVLGDQQESFYMSETEESFSFFIPECFVKPKEKKYRPLSIDEFLNHFDIGEVIVVRSKSVPHYVYHVLFVGYVEDSKNNGMNIILGQYRFSLKELFSSYEYDGGDNWVPFGVEVEE